MSQLKQNRRLSDPIVEEVRAVREAIDEEVGHDLKKLADRARRAGEEYRRTHGAMQDPNSDVGQAARPGRDRRGDRRGPLGRPRLIRRHRHRHIDGMNAEYAR